MNDEGKIYITISDERNGNAGGTNNNSNNDDDNNIISDYAKHQFIHLIKSQVLSTIQYSINNIGNSTGNYVEQREVSFAYEQLNNLIGIGVAAFAGFKYTGSPIGAAVGAGVAIVASIANMARSYNTASISNKKQNYEIEQLRKRAGLNSYIDNSRGTEN